MLSTCLHFAIWPFQLYVRAVPQVCEFCDRGSLADLVATGKLSPDPSQRDIWAVLCLLDIALGLEYLHSNSLVCCAGAGRLMHW